MNDLISRKALLKAIEEKLNSEVLKFIVSKIVIKEPAIEQGEAVTKLWESLGRWSAYLVSNGEQAELSPPAWLIDAVKNATTQQQPQSVSDALEEAAKICDDEAEGFYQRSGSLDHETNAVEFGNEHAREAYDLCKELAESIRALIKRNTEGVE